MKTKMMFFAMAIAFFTVACKDEERGLMNNQRGTNREVKFTDAELKVLYQMRNENNKVSMEEATRLANDVIGFLDGESAVKSGTTRSISSIGALTSQNLQSALRSSNGDSVEIPDTVAYVFNFGDDDGFAIISADTRIDDPILAYTGNGELGTETDNPGLAIFLEGAENYILRSIVEAEQKRDSLIGSIMAKLDVENESDTKATPTVTTIPSGAYNIRVTTTTGDWTTATQVGPLSPVEWGQWGPFNLSVPVNCSNKPSGKAPTGCMATAVAQIMAYWQYPASIDGKIINWTELNRYTGMPNAYDNVRGKLHCYPDNAPETFKTHVAWLMERIGKGVKMDWKCDASGTSMDNAVSYLQDLGYKGCFTMDYNYSTVAMSLASRYPVLARGSSTKTAKTFLGITIYYDYSDGHAWVIDGLLIRKQPVTMIAELIHWSSGTIVSRSTVSDFNYQHYLRNNWGEDGSLNGYFVEGSFNKKSDKKLDSSTKSSEDGNYQYENKIAIIHR